MSDSDSDWETVDKHFNMEISVVRRLEDIADREGRKPYELMREAVIDLINKKEGQTLDRVHSSVPEDGLVFEGDAAKRLNFTEMWVEGNSSMSGASDGDVIRAVQPASRYFDYYKFVYEDGLYVCETHVRFSIDIWNQIRERVRQHYI